MALKYQILTVEPVPADVDPVTGIVTQYANGIYGVESFAVDTANTGFTFTKAGGDGFIGRERVRLILPYEAT